jgi:D-alanyl-D-alanine carboxypeptidase/D-alanyl-D-alanine-endopeptidase (penicillin-binding protein 4)
MRGHLTVASGIMSTRHFEFGFRPRRSRRQRLDERNQPIGDAWQDSRSTRTAHTLAPWRWVTFSLWHFLTFSLWHLLTFSLWHLLTLIGQDAQPNHTAHPRDGAGSRTGGARRKSAWVGLLLIVLLAGCSAQRAHDRVLSAQLGEILNRHADTGAWVAARVINLDTGREVYAENIDTPVMPASNMKLVTAAVGLDMFGPQHRFATHLAFDGQDLWLTGTGDPAVGDAKIARQYDQTPLTVFDAWADALLARGITHIPGDLRYYAGALDHNIVHPSWGHDDLTHWYAAPVTGLNFNDNCVDITVYPTADGEPAGYEVMPPVAGLTVVNECVSGKDEPPTIARLAHADVVVLGGGCTKRRALKSKPMTDPAAFFADALRTHLASRGIDIAGDPVAAPKPLLVPLKSYRSIPAQRDSLPHGLRPAEQPSKHNPWSVVHHSAMTDVLWRICMSSQNLFAEALCKLSGQAWEKQQGRQSPGSWTAGEAAAKAFFARNDIDASQFVGADGSGLSRENRVTARLVSDLLVTMHDHDHAEAYRACLARPGGEGTLRGRMKELHDHVFAKTGYIRGVRALSGYVHAQDDRWYVFSFIYNGIPGSVKPFNKLQDEACRLLYHGFDPSRDGKGTENESEPRR